MVIVIPNEQRNASLDQSSLWVKKREKQSSARITNNERNAGRNNLVMCCTFRSYVLKYDRRIAVDSAAWLVTRGSTGAAGKKRRKKKKRYRQRSARVCHMHVQSTNQPGHEISKTNVNQTSHQTVAGQTRFYSDGCRRLSQRGDRFLRASTTCAFRRVTPIHADTKNTLA